MIGIIYGALGCLAQKDMKRLIAFSSVAHMGFVMLGIATLTSFGINAAIFGMVAHGLITGMLFFVAGSVQERLPHPGAQPPRRPASPGPEDGLDPRLLLHGLPRAARAWPGSGASSRPSCRPTSRPRACNVGLFRIFMVVAAIGTVLAAGYLLWMLQRVAMGKIPEEWEDAHIHDVHTAGVDRLDAPPAPDRRPRRLPGRLFNVTDDAVQVMSKAFGAEG